MAWTHYQKVLALLMVITGSFNTLSVKYADKLTSKGKDGELRHFTHPFMQSAFMFVGEMMCLLVFKLAFCYYNRQANGSVETNALTKGSRDFNPKILAIPALCDTIGTSIMYVGLTMTYASSFQMLRGSVIIFTGILSVAFLERKLGTQKWTGIILVLLGLIIVGFTDFLTMKSEQKGTNSVVTGDLLIICAQVITATQMVIEEKYVAGKDIPALQAVGWEGIFGFIGICLALIPLNYIHAPPPFTDNSQGTLEDSIDALIQISNNGRLFMAIIGIMFSIAFFNFAGISVTKELSATTRMILDSVRTLVIWAISLILGWQIFHYLQLFGFAFLIIGMCLYNDVIIPQLTRKCLCCLSRLLRTRSQSPDEEQIVNTAADDVENP
ncbi:solute carrier family 35 member F6-like [Leptopilina heterotoma]|uniref:solute carrier family 35 member F6-like n=1 Tax=Leptopilina heterotoma TaxID=63436 RepID=UPI001CAA1500|nr:solute carrier family 35 member F6-like [Leptopilina heterotoma]